MEELEFIVALTDHRFLGKVFVPYIIQRNGPFYSVNGLVKTRDLKSGTEYAFNKWEKELVSIIEKYSDENLARKFSRNANVSEFFSSQNTTLFKKQVVPFVEKCMFRVAEILMLSPVRLINKEVKYANLYDEDEIEVPPLFANPVFYFERTEKETRYSLKIYHDNNEIKLQNAGIRVLTSEPCMMVYQGRLLVFTKLNAKKLLPFFEKEQVVVPRSVEDKYYSGFVLNTIRDYDVRATGFEINESGQEKKAVLSLENSLQMHPVFVLMFDYGSDRFLPSSKRKTAVSLQILNNSYRFIKTVRDFDWETEMVEFLLSAGLMENNGNLSLKGNDLLYASDALYRLINWISGNTRNLEKKGIQVIQNKLDKKYFTGSQELKLQTGLKGDWFDVYASVKIGEFNIPFIKLRKYILNDIREFELPNGEIAILPEEWFARFRGFLPFAKIQGNKMHLQKFHFTLLNNPALGTDKVILHKLREMENHDKTTVSLPGNIKATLRSYQEDGFHWMFHLYKNGFGGCLADDMGLGKTLQTLSLLLKLKRKKSDINFHDTFSIGSQLSLFNENKTIGEIQPASLIVVPTSLVHNWENEIRKFTPSLKTYKHVGFQRNKAVEIKRLAQFYDIILTTYGTLRNDIELIRVIEFFYLILDESQYIKNSGSKTYKAVLELKARHKLVLTGTPIENALSDLWSQMNFLNNGLLGNLAFFKREFITPIEKHAIEEKQEKLQLLIRPFVLRRKKTEVAKDLPPLMEQVIYCEMTGEQHKKYEHEKSLIRNTILENIENEGIKKSSFIILQGLTKLRQLANHPSLLEKDSEENSGKFQEIFRMLENIVAENHKVLIFSSFVKHLELLKERIETERWKYSMLTGQSIKREKIINDFQKDPENRIFLISLKAGGVGLNLTGADYVFIIDPWWNPAAENQAINRAHRIGQDKHVFVYRFITENSIEEKIQQLKERKSSLADKFINSNNPFKEITKEEIVGLFS